MIKTLSKAQKMEREKFRIPRSVQDAILIRRIFADGIFQVGNQYSKTWSFTDINYAIASKADKTSMFLDYSELLNALDSGASAKITIYNRRINKAEFERSVLLPYIRNGYKGIPPTLKDFYHLLQMQPEPEAQGLALSSELFITGTLNTFAQHTNVDTQARIIAYDIRELGEQLMPLGMLVTLDAIYNRVIRNWKIGKRTWIFMDEFYLLFRYEYSANFLYKLWKRIRKYNGLVTGLTQNVDELLSSDTARLMLANSEFLVMLNQSATDREELAKLLNISDNQLGYVTNVPAGCGLIRCAGNIVPFTNSFSKNTKLYGLMTTKPDEVRKE